MTFPHALKNHLMAGADAIMALIPYPSPDPAKAQAAQVVAHRGYCGFGAKENTLAAFRDAVSSGVWGIEFDVRWTKDNEPIILHDRGTRRVFGKPCLVSKLSFAEVRQRFPEIPTLQEVVAEFGGKTHLMIEMKEKASAQRKERLKSLLASLEPIQDFHIICLSLGRLMSHDIFPRQALIPIAELNVAKMCSAARKHKFGGVMGQYVVVGTSTVRKQHAVHQKVGTGFIASERVLFRELNRGVDWIFTNHSPDICAALNRLKAQKPS